MVLQDLDYIFDTLDVGCQGYIEWIDLKEFDESIYYDPLDIEQLEAAIDTVCGHNANGKCRKEYFSDVVKELERRHNMEEKIKWDFRALDLEDVGRIPVQSALFLFKAVHGDRFSQRLWKTFLNSRINPEDEVCFDEVKLPLCNIPEFASANSDQDYLEQERSAKETAERNLHENHKDLMKMQEDDAFHAAAEREKLAQSSKLKNNADHLLNRMDEIGMEALLEDDLGDGSGFEGRARNKVSATELLDALKEKYKVLQEKILLQMLRLQIGEGMWYSLSEHEQQEKLFQLKLKEEKLRKEEKLETMAIHLPGSRVAVKYNVFGLMGESIPELERRMIDEEEKIIESGLSMDEVKNEFNKKLDDKEKENSSTEAVLIDINNRYLYEKDVLTKKLQGLSGHRTLSAIERETSLFAFVQARLRGVQEDEFVSCGICVGLSERVQPRKYDRSVKDPIKHTKLSSYRIKSHKNRRSHDGPVVPPKLFPLKSKLGRVDLALQLVQESERRFALEREVLLNMIHSKECLLHRVSARKLNEDERSRQLAVLLAQWQGWRAKSSPDKITSLSNNRKCLEEAAALKFESVKEEMRQKQNATVEDADASAQLLASLQIRQDEECRKFLNVGVMEKEELGNLWKEQTSAIIEEWFDNIAVILFGIIETSEEEDELLKALNDKYDALRDKLLMEALMNQFGKSEWDRLSEQERQNQLAKMKMLEKKLRKEGRYDDLAKLLGDAAQNSNLLNKMLGENRQKYLDQLNERLRNRQRRIEAGEDPDSVEDELLDEQPATTSGNILRDLDRRFEDERDALLRKLRDEQDRQQREKERQAELARLRMEARKASREANFDSAALVLGLAERNKAALEDRLKSDRERQEQLARERLAARRQRKSTRTEEDDEADKIEPAKDDITGWQDRVLKELSRTHEKERNLLLDMLQEKASEDLIQEARDMKEDERSERLNKLQGKRNELDFGVKSDQEEHLPILEMAIAVKYVCREGLIKGDDVVDADDIIVTLIADLQQLQDEETRAVMETLPEKSQPELVVIRDKQIEKQKYEKVENVAKLVFKYEGPTKDDEIVKALDRKYDALMDKLALEALKKQMSDAEWANLSEQERQKKLMKLRLEQKRLLREGKFDEAAKLLGDGFQADANLKKLMGENKKKYDEMLQERLRLRRERLTRGEPVDDLDMEGLPEDEDVQDDSPSDAKTLLEDLQKRYDDEKEALLARLHGADAQFMNERDRQAELARLRREQRRAEQEEKFGAAALVLGLAERNKTAAQERLKNDRTRQEQLAKERLERLRCKRSSQAKPEELSVVKDAPDMQDAVMKLVEKRHAIEQEDLVQFLQTRNDASQEQIMMMSDDARTTRLQELKLATSESGDFSTTVSEMTVLKYENRLSALKSRNKEQQVTDDDVTISIMADLQQKQDEEIAQLIKSLLDKSNEELIKLQEDEVELCKNKRFPNLLHILSSPEEIKTVDEDVLIGALENKYDVLKDKLILDALEKQMGDAVWAQMNEKDRQTELLKIKLEQKKLIEQGKVNEATRIMNNLLKQDTNLQSLLGSSKAEQEKHLKERLDKRRQRKAAGISDEEIQNLEVEEDKKFEEEVTKTSTGNVLQDLEKNFEAEKEALLSMLKGANSKLNSERQRQLELARLRREAKKAQAEEKFDAVALVFGMAKSQQAALDSKMKSDRSRQEQLARERLQARRNKRLAAQQEEPSEEKTDASAADTNDILDLQENFLNEMEKKHGSERELLIRLIQEAESSEHRIKAKEMKPDERETKLFELKEFRKQWRDDNGNPDEQKEMFEEAVAMKMEQMHFADDTNSLNDEDIEVKILADLQDNQDREAAYMMQDLAEKNAITLKQLIKIQQMARQLHWYDNVAATLLRIKILSAPAKEEKDVEDEIVEALKEKYDALKEKIYEEALKVKFGEEEWNAMSDKEKQEHLAKMKADEALQNEDEDTQNNLDSVTLPGMEKLIGKTRAKQERKLKDRMEKRKKAKAEGKSMEEIDADEKHEDAEEEGDVKKGSDVLKDLQDQFESEKDAILAMLMNADTKEMNEKERQLALARLRREKIRIKREEKYDGATLVLHLAKQNKAQKEASYENERARQEQLARERIAARRKKRKESEEKNEAEKLEEEENADEKEDLVAVEQLQREGTIALQDSLLNEMEKKHAAEQDVLLDMMQSIEAEKASLYHALNSMSRDDRNEKINLIAISRNKVKDQSRAFVNSQPPENTMNEEEKKTFNEALAEGRTAQMKVLKDGLVFAIANKKADLSTYQMEGDQVDGESNEEASVLLMADLQEKQTQENNAVMQALTQTDREMITRLKDGERKSRRAGWMDNIAQVVFGDKAQRKRKVPEAEAAEMEKELKEEEEQLEAEAQNQLIELEKEIEDKKQKNLSSMSEDEIAGFMEEIKRREETKRSAIQDQISRQKELAKQRLAEKRRKRDDKLYENDLASAMISNAHKRTEMLREKTMAIQGAQKDSLEERLRQRREDRKRREEEAAEKERLEIEAEKQNQIEEAEEVKGETQVGKEAEAGGGGEVKKEQTVDDGQEKKVEPSAEISKPSEPKVKKKKPMPPLPGGGMRREKTVVQEAAAISENKKQEMINMLMREQTSLAMKINKEQSRQEELVRNLREKRRKKMEAREKEAAAVLGLGARQKTIVEDRKKDERERQIGHIRDRVNRIKYERTMTTKDVNRDSKKSFHNLAQEQPDGLTEDEKMQRIAQEMERKFKEGGVQSVTTELSPAEEEQIKKEHDEEELKNKDSLNRGKLDEKTRAQILKERQKEKKLRRSSKMPPPGSDADLKDSDELERLNAASGGGD